MTRVENDRTDARQEIQTCPTRRADFQARMGPGIIGSPQTQLIKVVKLSAGRINHTYTLSLHWQLSVSTANVFTESYYSNVVEATLVVTSVIVVVVVVFSH